MDKSLVIKAFEEQLKISIDNLHKRDVELAMAAQGEEEYGADRLASKQEEFVEEAGANDSVQAAMADALQALNSIEKRAYSKVESGALVLTDQMNFLVCTAIREVQVEGKSVVGISIQSPIFQEMEGKAAGDSIEFNGKKITIKEIA